ncbi:hypothetical protein ACTXT7_010543 [Hymenolepis weldensis]
MDENDKAKKNLLEIGVDAQDGLSVLSERQQVEKSTMSLFIDEGHNSQASSHTNQEVKVPEPRLAALQKGRVSKNVPSSDAARAIIRQQHKHLLQCLQIATVLFYISSFGFYHTLISSPKATTSLDQTRRSSLMFSFPQAIARAIASMRERRIW